MPQPNWFIIPIAALVPLVLAMIWYHPSVMGKRLAKLNGGQTIGKLSIGKVAIFYLFSFLLAYVLTLMSVHQSAIIQLFFMDPEFAKPGSQYAGFVKDFMETYGDRHRSFGHGMIHGAEAGLFFGLALLGGTAIMQNKPLKHIWIHLVFWILCCSLTAGVTCAFF